ALYPHMVELCTLQDRKNLASVYHRGAQLVTVLTTPVLMLLVFFAEGVLYMWSGDPGLAKNTAPILSVLVIGTFLNGLMYLPYHLQIAHGWTGLTIKTNIVAVIVIIPAIFWMVPRYGGLGAAWVWVTLNLGYILISIHFMHRRLLAEEKWRWYSADVLFPVAGAITVNLFAMQLQPANFQYRSHWFIFLLLTGILSLASSAVLANRIRPYLTTITGRLLKGQFP
ncbi:MAG: polysaccharide biosynthesis protein, partial [Deltaproteobacteria bacterium]|nr:polysaccharide biosynthesis protein [Deltaproteobacteria bacterium]